MDSSTVKEMVFAIARVEESSRVEHHLIARARVGGHSSIAHLYPHQPSVHFLDCAPYKGDGLPRFWFGSDVDLYAGGAESATLSQWPR